MITTFLYSVCAKMNSSKTASIQGLEALCFYQQVSTWLWEKCNFADVEKERENKEKKCIRTQMWYCWYFPILYQCWYDLFAQSIWKRQCCFNAQTIFPLQIPHCRWGLLCLFPSICGVLFSVVICGLSFFSWSMLRPFLPDKGLWLFVFSAPVRPESGVMRLIPPESCISVCFFSLDMVCADLIPHYLYCEVC